MIDEKHITNYKIAEKYYTKWLYHFIDNDIHFEEFKTFFCFNDNITYKFNFNLKDKYNTYDFTEKQYKLFANLFLKNDWKHELKSVLAFYNTNITGYSTNYGEVSVNTKKFVDYITFQDSRVILQINIDKLIRLEKLKNLQK